MKTADAVRRWLEKNDGASNAELYSAFPGTPKPTLRRLAASVAKVRERRGLGPRGDVHFEHALESPEKSFRAGRWQVIVKRTFYHARISVPLTRRMLRVLREHFEYADRIATRELKSIELCAYNMRCQIARSAFIENGKLIPEWGNEFITLSYPLTRMASVMPQLWQAFTVKALERIEYTAEQTSERLEEEGEGALVTVPDGAKNKSDPVMLRPAQLTIYAHGPMVKK